MGQQTELERRYIRICAFNEIESVYRSVADKQRRESNPSCRLLCLSLVLEDLLNGKSVKHRCHNELRPFVKFMNNFIDIL